MSKSTTENSTEQSRQQYVVKANDLIRKTRYSLTAQQQKIVLFCISKIRPGDTPDTEYEISVDELCRACNLEVDNGGYYYKTIKEDIMKLTARLWIRMPDATEKTVSWISDATMSPYSGTIRFTFHKAMVPYLFDLRDHYTQYHLEDVLVFHGKHAIRLYEVLRSYTTQEAIEKGWRKACEFSLEELRDILAVNNSYPCWADFERYVIRKAVDEINRCSDEICVEYEPVRNGKTVTNVRFVIHMPDARQRLEAYREKRRRM